MPHQWYTLILIEFVLVMALFETWLEFLNLRRLGRKVPEEFLGLISEDKIKESDNYLRAKLRLEWLRRFFGVGVLVLLLTLGFFRWGEDFLETLPWGEWTRGMVWFFVITLMVRLFSIPFGYLHTFRIEEGFGFNRTTRKTFFMDQIKAILLTWVLGGLAYGVVLALFNELAETAWIWAFFTMLAFQLLLTFVAPIWLFPLFNRFEPLPEGDLKTEIDKMARDLGFHFQGIYTMDGSKRSTKANAFFTGFGKSRRIVLFDTLIAEHPREELLGILAHEIGHYRLGHIWKGFALSIVVSFFSFLALGWFLERPELSYAFGLRDVTVYANILILGFLSSVAGRWFGVISNAFSRKHEYEADRFASQAMKTSAPLISGLMRLTVKHLSQLEPHPLMVWVDYSHPPILSRIRALRGV